MQIIPQWIKNFYKYKTLKPVTVGQPLHMPKKEGGMCKCEDKSITVKNNHWIEYAQLKDGCHTHFMIGNCAKCGGVIGDDNLSLFLEQGKDPFLTDLKKTWRIK